MPAFSAVGRLGHLFEHGAVRRLTLTSLVLIPALVSTQSQDLAVDPDQVPAHVAVIDGSATLERDGQAQPATVNVPLLTGDRLRADRGRLEVLYADGSALDLDQASVVDFQSDALVRLLSGRVRLAIARTGQDVSFRVDAAPASVLIDSDGDYRIDLVDSRAAAPELDLTVLRGQAELVNESGRSVVRAGMHAFAVVGAEPSYPDVVNSAAWDAFDRWSEDQRTARLGAASSAYLPSDLRVYGGLLDRSGDWSYETSYGYVWYPRVSAGWRPYYDGEWSYIGAFGWTWVGFDTWAWPTHHYGRWGLRASRWFWIPDRRWGPAWVSWAFTNDYVSWCPLGFDGRPVFSIAYGTRTIDPWAGWTVIPARAFAPRVNVTRHFIAGRSLSEGVRSQFAIRTAGPEARGTWAASSALPVRSPAATHAYAIQRDATRTGGVAPRGPASWTDRSPTTGRTSPGSRTRQDPGAQPPQHQASPAQPQVQPFQSRTPSLPAAPSLPASPTLPSSPGRSGGGVARERGDQAISRAQVRAGTPYTLPGTPGGFRSRAPGISAPSPAPNNPGMRAWPRGEGQSVSPRAYTPSAPAASARFRSAPAPAMNSPAPFRSAPLSVAPSAGFRSAPGSVRNSPAPFRSAPPSVAPFAGFRSAPGSVRNSPAPFRSAPPSVAPSAGFRSAPDSVRNSPGPFRSAPTSLAPAPSSGRHAPGSQGGNDRAVRRGRGGR